MSEEPIDPVYLPFGPSILRKHFAPVHGSAEDVDRHLTYYATSAARYRACNLGPSPIAAAKLPRQIEKDERFWVVAAFLGLYYCDDRVARFSELLASAFREFPALAGLHDWSHCLNGDLRLYFEVALPSPREYQDWLRAHLVERHFVPYIHDAAAHTSRLEGPSHIDALLVNPSNGFAWAVEAKALSDTSYHVTFDALRNQIARNVDVLLDATPNVLGGLEARKPDRTVFTLLTPRLFKEKPHARLYGWLMNEYTTNPVAIHRDLPHRSHVDWAGVSRRLGWITFEDCERVLPGACRWLGATT
jgi:hypothetical protein